MTTLVASANSTIEWVVVSDNLYRQIGAVGFLGNQAVAVISFYADRDLDMNGRVSIGEQIASRFPLDQRNRMITMVAMHGRVDENIILRDPTFQQMAGQLFVNFASGLAIQGIYIAYFQRGVSAVANGIATRITSNMVKGFVIRKGFEAVVKKIFLAAAGA